MHLQIQHGSIYSRWLWHFCLLIVKPLDCSSQFLVSCLPSDKVQQENIYFCILSILRIRKFKNASGSTLFSETTTSTISLNQSFFFKTFFDWDSLHARLNSRYEAWSYNKKKHKKIKACRKSV